MWQESAPVQKYDWHEGTIIVPPENWFHQHFNSGPQPARYLALRWAGSKKFLGMRKFYGVDESTKRGGDQIEYEDEDPTIHAEFEKLLALTSTGCKMKGYHPFCSG
jgi:hypothetical protein